MMSGPGDSSSPIPRCPCLLICQEAKITPNRLIDILKMMNAIGITEFPAEVSFTVHFSLSEGQGDYRLALFLEDGRPGGNRHQLWSGESSLRSRMVVQETSIPVVVRFATPGQCQLALYVNGEQVMRRPLSIVQAHSSAAPV